MTETRASRLPARRTDTALDRVERKAHLEATIEQQRIDILVEASRWREASRPIDDGWRALMRFKVPLYTVGGMLLLKGSRHPHSVLRVARRLAAGALLFRRVRRLLR
ncbi:YqjK-like family protein [Halomonas sp. M4R5S39]|uniref:YqjK-like family protein n=1 Tax=Halomonas kalidii TaxID=3043293 RepID=UPI0024A8439B|nr:YqjK-like family protein [Halomonas kalidii]MDI5987058.1 YqjK-like family protein [Halomonas kalidii]